MHVVRRRHMVAVGFQANLASMQALPPHRPDGSLQRAAAPRGRGGGAFLVRTGTNLSVLARLRGVATPVFRLRNSPTWVRQTQSRRRLRKKPTSLVRNALAALVRRGIPARR